MITLRHHLLTIVAVFLALAAGIVLGGGPLSDVGPTAVTSSGEEETAPAADRAQTDVHRERRRPRWGRPRSRARSPTARSPW